MLGIQNTDLFLVYKSINKGDITMAYYNHIIPRHLIVFLESRIENKHERDFLNGCIRFQKRFKGITRKQHFFLKLIEKRYRNRRDFVKT